MKKEQDSYCEPANTFITSKLLIAISKLVFVKSSAGAGDGVAKAMDKMLGFVSKTYRAYLELRICDYIFILLQKHDHCALMFILKFILILRNVSINNINRISSRTIY